MTLALESLPQATSPLRRLDPRWKLAGLGLALLAIPLLQTPAVVAAALAGAACLALVGRLPFRWWTRRLGPALLVVLLFAAPLPFLLRGPGPTWELGLVALSAYGARAAFLLIAKTVTLLLLVLMLLVTSPLDATLQAAHALRVPGLLVQLLLLTYRYLFLFGSELGRVRVALRARGFRSRPTRHGYRTLGHVAGTLLVRGHERAERVGQAMRCRGFDGRFRSLVEFRTRPLDVLFFLAVVGSAALLLALDLSRR